VTKFVIVDDEVPNSTREIAGSFVVHVMTADVVPGVALTDEITGAVVSAVGGLTITVAVAYFVVFAALVARTVTVCLLATDAGAVYKPPVEILPTRGLIDQVTAILVVPDTLAVNCRV
jgi:hypothetical protein